MGEIKTEKEEYTGKRRRKRSARVEKELCVACGCCVKVCPLSAIWIFRGIYAAVDTEKCAGCGKCAVECPASVIQIREGE